MKQLLLTLLIAVAATLQLNATDLQQELQALEQWKVGATVSPEAVKRYGIGRCFTASAIPDAVFRRMQGKSYPQGCTVPRSSLRYLKVLHYDENGRIRLGEMVCGQAIASRLVTVFRKLYDQRYAIHSMRLIDDFDADDERSMQANNTSCFCFRRVKGSRKLSAHSRGMAVDINPLYNPCVRLDAQGRVKSIQPAAGRRYADRSASFPMKITKADAAWRVFTAQGFHWGGSWRHTKDYQHFER